MEIFWLVYVENFIEIFWLGYVEIFMENFLMYIVLHTLYGRGFIRIYEDESSVIMCVQYNVDF